MLNVVVLTGAFLATKSLNWYFFWQQNKGKKSGKSLFSGHYLQPSSCCSDDKLFSTSFRRGEGEGLFPMCNMTYSRAAEMEYWSPIWMHFKSGWYMTHIDTTHPLNLQSRLLEAYFSNSTDPHMYCMYVCIYIRMYVSL